MYQGGVSVCLSVIVGSMGHMCSTRSTVVQSRSILKFRSSLKERVQIISLESIFLSEYYEGTLNVILAAPHGGSEEPSSIPDRDAGCWDSETEECIWTHDCGEKDFER